MNKLNWGCGDKILEGWTNVDHEWFGGNIISDIRKEPLPFVDNHFDVIVANHALSMLDYQVLPKALEELYRVLKPGGIIRICDFDPIQAFEKFQKKDSKGLIIPDDVEPTLDGKFSAYLTWYGQRLSLLTTKTWVDKMGKAGFKAHGSNYQTTGYITEEAKVALGQDSRRTESNFIEGTK